MARKRAERFGHRVWDFSLDSSEDSSEESRRERAAPASARDLTWRGLVKDPGGDDPWCYGLGVATIDLINEVLGEDAEYTEQTSPQHHSA